MRKILVTLLTAAACATPFAHAEGTPITVEFKYDSSLLSNEAGAKKVLRSIKRQAKKACAFRMPVTGMPTFDRDCSDDLTEKAVSEIRLAAAQDGQAVTFVFASADTDDAILTR